MLIIQAKFPAVKQSKNEDFVGLIANGKLLLPGNENFYITGINSTFWIKHNIQVSDANVSFNSLSNTALIESQGKACLSIENKPVKTSVANSW